MSMQKLHEPYTHMYMPGFNGFIGLRLLMSAYVNLKELMSTHEHAETAETIHTYICIDLLVLRLLMSNNLYCAPLSYKT